RRGPIPEWHRRELAEQPQVRRIRKGERPQLPPLGSVGEPAVGEPGTGVARLRGEAGEAQLAELAQDGQALETPPRVRIENHYATDTLPVEAGAMQGAQPGEVRRLQQEDHVAPGTPRRMNAHRLVGLPLRAARNGGTQVVGSPRPAGQADVADGLQREDLPAVVQEVPQVEVEVLDEAAPEAHLAEQEMTAAPG